MHNILGIAPDTWISSATILVDGKIIAACSEERFNRQKNSKAFPKQSIEFCLKKASLNFDDLDSIVISWNPGTKLSSASSRYTNSIQWRGDYLHSFVSSILKMMNSPQVIDITQIINNEKNKFKLKFLNHHKCHIASTYYPSGFNSAAILTIDGRGDEETGTFSLGKNNKIETFQSTLWPHSLGLFYAAITEYLGFAPHSDEWKVMALAAYGDKNSIYSKKFLNLLDTLKNGQYEIDLSMFTYYLFDKHPKFYNHKLIELLGPDRKKGEPLLKRHKDIAAALQNTFEKIVFHQLNHLYKVTKTENICLAGGAAMNSVFNGKILKNTKFKNLYVPPYPDDTGVSIGAAIYEYSKQKNFKRVTIKHNYLGPSFEEKEIDKLIKNYKLNANKYSKIENIVAKELSMGKLIGWFQGSMEFGQRALGNRSILADPRNPKSKDMLNLAVKFRENFRPFAPAILEEYVEDYFDIPANEKVPFMESVYPIKKNKQKLIPSVVFVDGTGRLQTVSKKNNQLFYNLIKKFNDITGVPIIINTSFNLNGEPMVCSPEDAIKTFFCCGLDILVIDKWLIKK